MTAPSPASGAIRLALDLPSEWEAIELVRSSVALCVQAARDDPELSTQVAMASAELLENALKHGDSKFHPIRYSLDASLESVRLRVENGFSDPRCAAELRSRLEIIAAAPSPYEAYIAQLAAVVEQGHDSEGQLGLFRIAYESGFDLTCGFDAENEVLYVEGHLRNADV